jgi:hypothetical protein
MSTHGFFVYDGTDVPEPAVRQMVERMDSPDGEVILRGCGYAQALRNLSPHAIFGDAQAVLRRARDAVNAEDGADLGVAYVFCDEAPTVRVRVVKGHPVNVRP